MFSISISGVVKVSNGLMFELERLIQDRIQAKSIAGILVINLGLIECVLLKFYLRCTQYGSSAAEYSEIYMRCSHPGLKGNIITLDATSWHVAVLEIEIFDCPNGFVHLNNKCVKWLADDTLVNHHKQCDLYRGKLLDASENILLALSMMSVADRGEIFSGEHYKN